jgi:hypothetical protein
MSYGMIRGIAQIWMDRWLFRLLIINPAGFVFAYIGATNYRFRYGDIVSYDHEVMYWLATNRTVRFELVQTGVEAK